MNRQPGTPAPTETVDGGTPTTTTAAPGNDSPTPQNTTTTPTPTTAAPQSTTAEPTPASPLPDDILAQYQAAAERRGGHETFAQILYNDNHTLRAENRALRAQVDARAAAVNLDGPAADAYRALAEGRDPETVAELLRAAPDLLQRIETMEREALVQSASIDPEGRVIYKANVLSELLSGQNITPGKDGGVNVKDGNKEVPLAEWLETHKADYLPAVRVGAGTVNVLPQRGGRPATTSSYVADTVRSFQEERDARPNPLLRSQKP